MYFYYFPFDLFLEIGHKLDNFFRWLKKNCFWDFLTFSQKFDSQFQLRQKGKIKSFSIFEIKRHGIATLNQSDMSTCFLRGQSSLIFIRSSSILFTRQKLVSSAYLEISTVQYNLQFLDFVLKKSLDAVL